LQYWVSPLQVTEVGVEMQIGFEPCGMPVQEIRVPSGQWAKAKQLGQMRHSG
jgi:hypothetical protein